MSLKVEPAGIQEVLDNLKSGKWLVPRFQREFVWSEGQIISLIESIFNSRPIGMATLWSQADEDEDYSLTLESISLPDRNEKKGISETIYFKDFKERPKEYYAILDGRQRSTAMAIAFGGFKQTDGKFSFAGEFFLNVSEVDPTKQIVFVKTKDFSEKGLSSLSSCIGQGYFPLALRKTYDYKIWEQWYNYIEEINNKANYPDDTLPEEEELTRRKQILKRAFEGLMKVKLAVYIVPNSYDLDVICDIFETLNTSGTTVSTVDLIHSSLYNDTVADEEPILLRDWMNEMSEFDGAIGWISKNNRPELTAQIVTGCYLASNDKPKPKVKKSKKSKEIKSIKSSDLLRTPAPFYNMVIDESQKLAEFLMDFQLQTSEGLYKYKDCPYPITVGIYVALRWTLFKEKDSYSWDVDDLNNLFSVYFWRASITKRFDQGSVAQFPKDLNDLKEILNDRDSIKNDEDWKRLANKKLNAMFEELPSKSQIKSYVLDGRIKGALKKALVLVLIGRVSNDLIEPKISIQFPDSKSTDLHHIYPKAWCKKSAPSRLRDLLSDDSENDSKNSVANLIPLNRKSNKTWSNKIPDLALDEIGISYDDREELLNNAFIDKIGYKILNEPEPNPKDFWDHRAELISLYIYDKLSLI